MNSSSMRYTFLKKTKDQSAQATSFRAWIIYIYSLLPCTFSEQVFPCSTSYWKWTESLPKKCLRNCHKKKILSRINVVKINRKSWFQFQLSTRMDCLENFKVPYRKIRFHAVKEIKWILILVGPIKYEKHMESQSRNIHHKKYKWVGTRWKSVGDCSLGTHTTEAQLLLRQYIIYQWYKMSNKISFTRAKLYDKIQQTSAKMTEKYCYAICSGFMDWKNITDHLSSKLNSIPYIQFSKNRSYKSVTYLVEIKY